MAILKCLEFPLALLSLGMGLLLLLLELGGLGHVLRVVLLVHYRVVVRAKI